ncbi:hypothetical protein [Frigidibacter sp. ROC022]|uniref:hypothetical protein n=1 Tax=Frigidibacter sp. ROC022 TaxID=2971796 RepID=UPI00215B1E74|nr:hypothetical protein [Frigidibacter sp. ROC022]MCR8723366.1 hypothetical protein [Frigidibacter sp. ROC022]
MQSDIELLTAILDQLIPANPDRAIPGAGQLGLASGLIEATEPTLASAIRALLSEVRAQPGEVSPRLVSRLEKDRPEDFRQLLSAVYMAYYSRPDMREKLGVGAHPVHPKGYPVDREPPELMKRLTAPVRARGPIYRDPTGGAA